MVSKVGYFVGLCHHCLGTHTHAEHYPLFGSGMKTDLWTVALSKY